MKILFIAAILIFMMSACSHDGQDIFGWTDTGDPRIGKVPIEHSGFKVCDGTTLIYGGAVSGVVENSTECAE